MRSPSDVLRSARNLAGLSQRELALRAGTSQPAVARAESGHAGITVETLRRLLDAAGFELSISAEPRTADDPVTAAYRQDVDRTLLRQNLRRSVEDRLRMAGEYVDALDELERATRSSRPKGLLGR